MALARGSSIVVTGCSKKEQVFNVKIVDLTGEISNEAIAVAESTVSSYPVTIIFSSNDVAVTNYADTKNGYGILITPTDVWVLHSGGSDSYLNSFAGGIVDAIAAQDNNEAVISAAEYAVKKLAVDDDMSGIILIALVIAVVFILFAVLDGDFGGSYSGGGVYVFHSYGGGGRSFSGSGHAHR